MNIYRLHDDKDIIGRPIRMFGMLLTENDVYRLKEALNLYTRQNGLTPGDIITELNRVYELYTRE